MDIMMNRCIHVISQGVIPMYEVGKPAYPKRHEMSASGRTIEREG